MNWIKKNWKTTLMGCFTLAVTGFSAAQNPAILMDPKTLSTLASAIGLIVAADATSKPKPPAPPAAQ